MLGQRFGKLVIIAEGPPKGKDKCWLCKCDCGETKVIRARSLKQGTTTCGKCSRSSDLVGQRFGRLVVIKRVSSDNPKYAKWLCKCDCGNFTEAYSKDLNYGDKKSCGCLVYDRPFEDLTGQRFGRLVVVKRIPSKQKGTVRWLSLCDCGKYHEANTNALKSGGTRSCGCLNDETRFKHGMTGTPEHASWISMHQRCYNPNNKDYSNYGKKGIKVDWEWHRDNPDGFANFLRDKGYITDPNKNTNDRLDNDSNYGPKNDNGWQDRETQARNKSSNKITQEEAEFIRDLYYNRKVSIKNIAEFFRCSERIIRNVIKNKSWIK